MRQPLCEICYKGPQDGMQVFLMGVRNGKHAFRCKPHARTEYTPPIDIEVKIVEERSTSMAIILRP